MKEATGELNMTVVAILIIAALAALILTFINGSGGQALIDRFTNEVVGKQDTTTP